MLMRLFLLPIFASGVLKTLNPYLTGVRETPEKKDGEGLPFPPSELTFVSHKAVPSNLKREVNTAGLAVSWAFMEGYGQGEGPVASLLFPGSKISQVKGVSVTKILWGSLMQQVKGTWRLAGDPIKGKTLDSIMWMGEVAIEQLGVISQHVLDPFQLDAVPTDHERLFNLNMKSPEKMTRFFKNVLRLSEAAVYQIGKLSDFQKVAASDWGQRSGGFRRNFYNAAADFTFATSKEGMREDDHVQSNFNLGEVQLRRAHTIRPSFSWRSLEAAIEEIARVLDTSSAPAGWKAEELRVLVGLYGKPLSRVLFLARMFMVGHLIHEDEKEAKRVDGLHLWQQGTLLQALEEAKDLMRLPLLLNVPAVPRARDLASSLLRRFRLSAQDAGSESDDQPYQEPRLDPSQPLTLQEVSARCPYLKSYIRPKVVGRETWINHAGEMDCARLTIAEVAIKNTFASLTPTQQVQIGSALRSLLRPSRGSTRRRISAMLGGTSVSALESGSESDGEMTSSAPGGEPARTLLSPLGEAFFRGVLDLIDPPNAMQRLRRGKVKVDPKELQKLPKGVVVKAIVSQYVQD